MSTLSVNIPESLHHRAQSLAQADGVSLEQFIATALVEKVAVLDADTYIRERAARGSREKFERVMAKVPDVEPEPHDRPRQAQADGRSSAGGLSPRESCRKAPVYLQPE